MTDLQIEPVARVLLGVPNKHLSKPTELRYGTHGSLKVDLNKNAWFDHEANCGGGVLDLVNREIGGDHSDARRWLADNGLEAKANGLAVGTGRRIVDTYDYFNEHRELLFQAVRYEPKGFSQRRPAGNGAWIPDLNGVRRVPYRLPALIEAVATKKVVVIVEGEKDVEALRALDIAATTCSGGAGKWRDEYNQHFKAASVVIIGDNDEPGRNHARDVAKALAPIATRVRVLDLTACWPECPPKGDISDWLASGGTREKLIELIKQAPDYVELPPTPAGGPVSAAPSTATSKLPVMAAEAYYGLVGEVVKTISPHSEADPVALLLQFLTLAGNIIGRQPHYQVESDQHYSNLFCVLVGTSSKGRKGTSMGRVRAVVKGADETWAGDRLKSGLASGEGLINEVRDSVEKWDPKEKVFEKVDPGASDKRLMIVEPEFAGALAVAERPGNTLSPLIRRAWDGDKLQTLTKNSPLSATGAHISVIAHITEDELRTRITRTDLANGFANRFLFALIRRSKELPFGGDLSDGEILNLGDRLKAIIEKVGPIGRVQMNAAAKRLWRTVYSALSAEQPGLLGAVTARAEAQTVRLALLYALLDGRDEIDEPHLRAALAVWEYCESSAAHIFGNMLGDPVADEILRALQQVGAAGMTRTAISNLFGRHQAANRIGAALALLALRGRARMEPRETAGRPTEMWFAQVEAR
jgi:hypothetical protein